MIIIKTSEQIEKIKQGGKILAQTLESIIQKVEPGISTAELNQYGKDLIKKAGGEPAFEGYHPSGFATAFPGVICASINNQVVHGIPSDGKILKQGDIISIDIGLLYKGHYTDMAKTVAVGEISQDAKNLMETTNASLFKGIDAANPGNTIQDIGRAIEEFVKPYGYGIVRDLVGHGVGNDIWEEPQIPNYIVPGTDKIILKPGMVIAIEPMLNLGEAETINESDGWTISTADGKLSAHFEHTIIITESGHEIVTLP